MIDRMLYATAALALLAASPPAVDAQTLADYDYENLRLTAIGLDYGYLVAPSRVEPASAYSLSVDVGFLGPGVRLVPSATYWTSTLKSAELDRLAAKINELEPLRSRGVQLEGADLGTVDWSDVSLGLDAHIVWETALGVYTYLGAGAALHALNGEGTAIDDTFVEDLLDSVTAGASGLAGLEYSPVDGLRLYGEGRYTVLNDLHYPMARVGAAFVLPGRGYR